MYQYKITLKKSKISEEEVKFSCSQDVAENSFIHHLFFPKRPCPFYCERQKVNS